MKNRFLSLYALAIHQPISGLCRDLRRLTRRLRGKTGGRLQQVKLPRIHWKACSAQRRVPIHEYDKKNKNVRINELAIINLIAAECEDNSNIFEIGTFDGRTTLNLAFSSPHRCRIYTLDLNPLPDLPMGVEHESGVGYSRIGAYRSNENVFGKITRLEGDSTQYDFTPYMQSCSLVFVDGSHTYDDVIADTQTALDIVKPGGVVLWHDYGIWEGVTTALEDMERTRKLGLKHIAGTSLVYWKNRLTGWLLPLMCFVGEMPMPV